MPVSVDRAFCRGCGAFCGHTTVARAVMWCSDLCLHLRGSYSPREDRDRWIAYRYSVLGQTLREIADLQSMSFTTIHKILIDRGVPIRHQGSRKPIR